MRFKDILLTSTISTLSLLGIFSLYKYLTSSEEVNESSDDYILIEDESNPGIKEKILNKFKPMKKAYISKKLLDELEKRDVSITIEIKKGEKI